MMEASSAGLDTIILAFELIMIAKRYPFQISIVKTFIASEEFDFIVQSSKRERMHFS
jgi:hypothetical protein